MYTRLIQAAGFIGAKKWKLTYHVIVENAMRKKMSRKLFVAAGRRKGFCPGGKKRILWDALRHKYRRVVFVVRYWFDHNFSGRSRWFRVGQNRIGQHAYFNAPPARGFNHIDYF